MSKHVVEQVTELTCRYKRQTSVIKFTWIIEHFLSWCNTYPKIKSPVFPDRGDHGTKWQLQLQPKVFSQQQNETKMLLELRPVGLIRDDVNIQAHFHVLPNREVLALERPSAKDALYSNQALNFFWVKRNPRLYYPDGNLTIQCVVQVDHFVCVNEGASSLEQTANRRDCWQRFFDKKSLSDVKFIVNDLQFPAHRIVLAAASPVFDAMFHQFTGDELRIVDVEPQVFNEMLRFMYTGQVEHLDKMAPELAAAAERFQLNDLLEMCVDKP